MENVVAYYNKTAAKYDRLHDSGAEPEHMWALEHAWPLLAPLGLTSALDVGCGTGRSLAWISGKNDNVRLCGIDPSQELLNIAKSALPRADFTLGGGERLPWADNSFDFVLASAIMHHVADPSAVIREMFRVSSRAVLVSDHNNFAFGGSLSRRLRLMLFACGLLDIATFVKQGFRKQGYSEEDGYWYPYSLFSNFVEFSARSSAVYVFPTRPVNSREFGNLLLNQSHLAILGIKKS